MFEKILVPTDGSEFTKEAVKKAVELAKITGSKITALYVVDHTLFMNVPMDSAISSVYSILKNEGQDAVAYVKRLGAENGVEVNTIVIDGSPVKVILEATREHDLVVMGTLGRSGVSKLLLGSVAEKVVRHSPIPVLVIRSEVGNK